jgi:hypothetical protein
MARFSARFPEINDPYLEIYSCALERDILWQGRIYVTNAAICFYSKIFSNELKQIIYLKDVDSMEKAMTAGIFPNAIRITAGESKVY